MPVLLFFLFSTLLLTEVTAVDECDSGPCVNGAACSDQYADSYTCECVGAFQGVNCELPLDFQVCPFGHVYEYAATITTGVLPHNFSCQANFRFQGATEVNFTFVSHDIEANKDAIWHVWLEAGFFADSSSDSGALDSGDLAKQPTLTFKDAGSNYWIEMFTNQTIISGSFTLEISADRDDCYPIPCMNGATCIDLLRDYRCICAPGYDGISCQDDTDECRSGPCVNDGTCVDRENRYSCDCTDSYTGINCETGIVIVNSTTVSVANGVHEGSFTPAVIFNLTFAPSTLATYSVGGADTLLLWTVDAFFTSDPNAVTTTSNRRLLLTTAQETTLWQPPASTTISGLNALQVTVPGGVVCSDMEFFCAVIGRNTGSFPFFQLTARDDPVSFQGCVSINCRGVEITDTTLQISSRDLQAGESGQTVSFNVQLDSESSAGSVNGSSLWSIAAFGSDNSLGTGSRFQETVVPTSGIQGTVGIDAGTTSTISDLSFEVNLGSGFATCDDYPFICIEVSKGSQAIPNFGLSGGSNLVACQAVTCRAQVTETRLPETTDPLTQSSAFTKRPVTTTEPKAPVSYIIYIVLTALVLLLLLVICFLLCYAKRRRRRASSQNNSRNKTTAARERRSDGGQLDHTYDYPLDKVRPLPSTPASNQYEIRIERTDADEDRSNEGHLTHPAELYMDILE